MMKYIFLTLLMAVLYSCKKDTAILCAPDEKITDARFGNYNCIKITHTMGFDSLGNITNTKDTASSSFVANIGANGVGNYNVSVDAYSFVTSTNLNDEYFAACPNGPCSSVKFYATDSIKIFRKVNNAISIYYIGKK